MNNIAKSKHKGFTMVETIVSVAIIGILAAAVISTVLAKPEAVQAKNSIPDGQVAIKSDNVTDQASTPTVEDIVSDPGNQDIQGQAEQVARRMEHRIIQTAMDLMMIDQNLTEVKSTPDTADMSQFPAGRPLYPTYLREQISQYEYRCDSKGEVFQFKQLSPAVIDSGDIPSAN